MDGERIPLMADSGGREEEEEEVVETASTAARDSGPRWDYLKGGGRGKGSAAAAGKGRTESLDRIIGAPPHLTSPHLTAHSLLPYAV